MRRTVMARIIAQPIAVHVITRCQHAVEDATRRTALRKFLLLTQALSAIRRAVEDVQGRKGRRTSTSGSSR